MKGEYQGSDGRTYRLVAHREGEPQLYREIHPIDFPAARAALDELMSEPVITYEPMAENREHYIIATVDLYPHGPQKADGKTKIEAAEAMVSLLKDFYEAMWKEQNPLSPETPNAPVPDGKDVASDSEWVVSLPMTKRSSWLLSRFRLVLDKAKPVLEWLVRDGVWEPVPNKGLYLAEQVSAVVEAAYDAGLQVRDEAVRELVRLVSGANWRQCDCGWTALPRGSANAIRGAAERVKL